MNKKLKRSFLAAGIVVGVCALVWGGLTLLRNGSRSTVKVYPVTGISMTGTIGATPQRPAVPSPWISSRKCFFPRPRPPHRSM